MATNERKDILGIYKKFILFCCFFLILLIGLEICSGLFVQKKSLPEEAWSVTINNVPSNLSPGSILIPKVNRGDIIVCTTTLPDAGFIYPSLVFQAPHGKVSVTCGNKTLFESDPYSSGNTRALIDQIPLSDADLSQPVSIMFTVEESYSFASIPNIIYTEEQDGFSTFIKARGVTFTISLFLFFVGVIGTIICSASIFLGKKLTPLITISQFSFWASLCMFCHLDFILLFVNNDTVNSVLELVSFYLALLFVCLIIYPKLVTTKKHRRTFKILILAYLGYCIVSLLLPLFTKMSILDTFSIALVILIAAVVYSLYRCVWQWIRQPERMSFPVTGFMILAGYAIIEELCILSYTAGLSIFRTPEMLILITGILIFAASSLIDYFVWFKKSTIQETVEESWKRFSEPNSEPGISGYQKTLALLKELEDSQAQYTIATISIDNIDELKLSTTPYPVLEDNFARLLHLVFSSYGITGNLGNGKFLVALPDMPEGKMKQLLRAFKELVRRDNDNHPEAKIIFSAGYALSTDSEDDEIVKICQLANNSRQVQEQQLLQ